MAKEYRTSILSVYDEDRQKISIPAIKGESAYEYAINNGYVGSKEDYAKDCNPDNIKKDVEDFVLEELAKRGQLKPEFANSKEELDLNGDPTKLYVLPDGYIWAHMKTTKPAYDNLVETSTEEPGGTAIYNGSGYSDEYRWSSSKKAPDKQTYGRLTGWIDYKQGATLRLKNFGLTYAAYVNGGYIVLSYSDGSTGTIIIGTQTTDEYSTVLNTSGVTHFRISGYGKGQSPSIGTPIITLNQEIVEGTIESYEWVQTQHRFVPADYEDQITNLEAITESNTSRIELLENSASSQGTGLLMYISPTGSDDNDGLTEGTPKKTVTACVNAGAVRISAKRGLYNEKIALYDINEIEIFPTDNDLVHETGLIREPIIFDTSDSIDVSSLSNYNSIKQVAYSNTNNTQFDKVFIKQSQPPLYGDDYGSRYNATVWLFSEDEKEVCIKLKPVLTIAECEAEAETFTYVDGFIYINANMTSVNKIIVPTNWDNGIHIEDADRVVLKEVEVRFAGCYNINVKNCAYFDFYRCACKYTSYGSGFHPLNSNGIMTSCYATKNYDGYGISGYGHTTYIDCVSEFNFDDGMSHHSGTSGTVIGGRYEGNGKGGCVPAYGAEVNIYGGIYKDNKSFGIGYLWYSESDPAHGTVEGAIMVGNAVGLSVQSNCDVTTSNCVYKDNTTDKDIKGNLVEYNSVYNTNNNNNNNNNTEPQYDNLLFETKNADGSDYYGDNGLKGYRLNYRYSASKKGETEAPGYQVLGYIPVDGGDIIRIKNVTQANLTTDGAGYATAYFFDGNFSQLGGAIYFNGTEFTNKMYTFTVPSYDGIAWCKLTLIGVTNSTIVTKNQEIIENNNNNNNGNNGNNSSTPYTNRLPSAVMGSDQATGWLEGKGYTQNARLSGSAGIAYTGYTTIAGVCVSGYITGLKIGDVIRIKGFYPPQGVSTYVISYNGTTQVAYNQMAPAHADTYWETEDWYTIKNPTKLFEATMTFTLTSEYFGDNFDSIRFSGVFGDNVIVTVNEEIDIQESEETYEEAILRIKNWKYPIFEDAPVFLLESDKPAISAAEENNDAVYAKYDALMAKYPWYITRQNCGMASDGNTPIYVYHFKEPTPHYSSGIWSETKPVILVCSGVHPTERTGIYSMYYAMEEITENLKLLDLRRNIHFVIMPIINPTAVNDSEWGVRNPEGIQVHYNFEVDFKYPTDAGYVDLGNRNHGGTTPLSIPETQYFDSLMQEYKDNLACVLSCHNYDVDGTRGTDYIWCSCATHFMCNVAYRLIDKMSAAWRAKHGSYFDEGLVWANNYALQAKESGSPSLFGSAIARDSWDYRVGMASLSGSGGTEYKQALKYGVHGINVESCDRWLVMDRDYSKKRTRNVITAGAETYINFFRTYMAAYDLKNKKDYAPNLPME